MRALILTALTLTLAGCRIEPTAPTSAQRDAVSYQSPAHAGEWLRREYQPNDRFPEVADLTYRVVGSQLVIDARFTSPPAAIGDDWFGNIELRRGADAFAHGGYDALRIEFGQTHINGGPPMAPHTVRVHGEEPGASWSRTAAASAVIRGPLLRLTCDASLLDFSPELEAFAGVPHPFTEPTLSIFEKALASPVAAVER